MIVMNRTGNRVGHATFPSRVVHNSASVKEAVAILIQ